MDQERGDPINEGLARIESNVATLQSDVAVLKNNMTTLQSDVAILKNDVAILKSDVVMLKNDVAWLKRLYRSLDYRVWLILAGVIITILVALLR
jgi:peptidoglycan hydrolase CwlO-like protein